MRRARQWSASRIAFELGRHDVAISRRTVSRHLVALERNWRRFIDPTGESNRVPRPIVARRPGHMVHVDVKKVGIPDSGGWRVHGRDSAQAKAVASATKAVARAGYVYLHSTIDGSPDSPTPRLLTTKEPPQSVSRGVSERRWI